MCVSPVRVVNPLDGSVTYMPCGHCPECVAQIRNRWTKRIYDSAHAHVVGGRCTQWFITLTYDNQHLPLSTDESIIDDDLGTIETPYTTRVFHGTNPFRDFDNQVKLGVKTDGYVYEKRMRTRYHSESPDGIHGFLCRADLQKFMKRLRKQLDKYYNVKVAFFGCGEYGGDEWDETRHTHIVRGF